jgi:hypothetical protein
MNKIATIVRMCLCYSVSQNIWLLGDFDYVSKTECKCHKIDFLHTLCNTIYDVISPKEIYNVEERVLPEYSIKVKCYEVCGEQIRDLLRERNDSISEYFRVSNKFDLQLSSKEIDSCELLIHTLSDTFMNRAVLVSLDPTTTASQSPYSSTTAGIGQKCMSMKAIGCNTTVFINIEFVQKNKSLHSTSSNNGPPICLTIICLADPESFSYKPKTSQETLYMVPYNIYYATTNMMQDTNRTVLKDITADKIQNEPKDRNTDIASVIIDKSLHINHNTILSFLSASSKSLISLLRVTNSLCKNYKSSDLSGSSSGGGQSSSRYHIPFRESVLTKILENYILGNCCNTIYIRIDINSKKLLRNTTAIINANQIQQQSATTTSLSPLSSMLSYCYYMKFANEMQNGYRNVIFVKKRAIRQVDTISQGSNNSDIVSKYGEITMENNGQRESSNGHERSSDIQSYDNIQNGLFWSMIDNVSNDIGVTVTNDIRYLNALEAERTLLFASMGITQIPIISSADVLPTFKDFDIGLDDIDTIGANATKKSDLVELHQTSTEETEENPDIQELLLSAEFEEFNYSGEADKINAKSLEIDAISSITTLPSIGISRNGVSSSPRTTNNKQIRGKKNNVSASSATVNKKKSPEKTHNSLLIQSKRTILPNLKDNENIGKVLQVAKKDCISIRKDGSNIDPLEHDTTSRNNTNLRKIKSFNISLKTENNSDCSVIVEQSKDDLMSTCRDVDDESLLDVSYGSVNLSNAIHQSIDERKKDHIAMVIQSISAENIVPLDVIDVSCENKSLKSLNRSNSSFEPTAVHDNSVIELLHSTNALSLSTKSIANNLSDDNCDNIFNSDNNVISIVVHDSNRSSKDNITSTKKDDSPLRKKFGEIKKLRENESDGLDHLSEKLAEFLRAVSFSKVSEVQHFVDCGVDISVKNSFGRDAMQIAARNGCLQIMKILYERGASIYTRGEKGDTIFHLASGNGHVTVLEWLSQIGFNSNVVDMYGQTPSHFAARRCEVDVLRYLHYSLHFPLNEEDFDGRTPLDLVPKHSNGHIGDVAETISFLRSVTIENIQV